ncbi:glucosaminidase domain-containing protein [Streptococcus sp. A23]|uniref:glucosaminidase domain-containing protein n=1 Tax=Streptococcus TaxID=1301 RepID=UPI000CF441C5
MIAQAIHESNYGQSGLSISLYNNLFGIKGAYNEQSVSLQTYVNIVRQPHFNSVWRSNTSSYLDATNALTGTYATDTAYAAKLNDIIELHGLTQYDGYYTNENVSSVANLIWNPYRAQYTTQETLNLDIAWANR